MIKLFCCVKRDECRRRADSAALIRTLARHNMGSLMTSTCWWGERLKRKYRVAENPYLI